jgi:DNA-binding transcriptional MerR regulator
MHCPKCGAEAPLTQKFCRSCGFSLEKIPQLVAQQPSEAELLSDEVAEKLQQRKQKIENLLSVTGIGFSALVALSLLTGLIYLMVAGNIPLIPAVIILILLLTGIIAGSLGIYSERLKKTLADRSSPGPSTLPPSSTPSTLPHESHRGPLISVTERTTSLLEKNDTVKNEKN